MLHILKGLLFGFMKDKVIDFLLDSFQEVVDKFIKDFKASRRRKSAEQKLQVKS